MTCESLNIICNRSFTFHLVSEKQKTHFKFCNKMQCNKTLKIPIFSSSNLQREVTNINYAPKLSEKTGNGNLMLLPFLYFPMLARKLVFFPGNNRGI